MSPSNPTRYPRETEDASPEQETQLNPSARLRRSSCEIEAFKRTGLPETDPVVTICETITEGHVSAEELSEEDISRLMAVFNRYRKAYPQDEIANQMIDPDNIESVARFILEYIEIYNEFKMLKRANPNDKSFECVDDQKIFEVVQFMRNRYRQQVQ